MTVIRNFEPENRGLHAVVVKKCVDFVDKPVHEVSLYHAHKNTSNPILSLDDHFGPCIMALLSMEGHVSKAVLVTTEFRGVFFGHVENDKKLPAEITLTGVRNCIYWSQDCNGFLGLAATGPTKNCTIGATVPKMTLYKITSVTPCEDSAVKAWEKF